MDQEYICPSCQSNKVVIFHEIRQVPAHSVLLFPSKVEAINYPKGDVILGFCQHCGFIYNSAFDHNLHEYSAKYEETQGYSATFNAFSRKLAQRLIKHYDLRDKTILEIGCGKGEFISLLCEMGPNQGLAFDPAYIEQRNTSQARDKITFIKDFYSEKYAHYESDFVCCKMTLEHIPDTDNFVKMVRNAIGERKETAVFFQVPDVRRVLRDVAYWDIYYEHCSYFSQGSLARLFRRNGFDVLKVYTEYDDQYLMIECIPADSPTEASLDQEDDMPALKQDVEEFTQIYPEHIKRWQNTVEQATAGNKRAVIWGAGSKGVAFFNTLNIIDEIPYAVDINPHKRNTYMAGTGQKIVAPNDLLDYDPDVVIVMNAIYREEIKKSLDELGIHPDLITV